MLPGHSRYCCGIPVVGLDDQIRNSRRAAGVANHDAGMANHETLRVAHEEAHERDRSLSIARGPLRAWRASAPARRRGTRAEYERECVNVTSVCGTTCERGGASLGARGHVASRCPSAAGLEADAHALEADAHPLGLVWQGSPPMPPVHLRLARAPGAASARSGGRRRRRPSSSR